MSEPLPEDPSPAGAASSNLVTCDACGGRVDTSRDLEGCPLPCQACGSIVRRYSASVQESVRVRDYLQFTRGREGEKKPRVWGGVRASPSFDRGRLVDREQLFDRDSDWYTELVTDPDTGEIIHEDAEPLSAHHGHGSAKPKKPKKPAAGSA